MSCGNNSNKNCYQKSCERYYNNNVQALAAGASTTLVIAGARVVDSGISTNTQPQSFEITKSGLYHLSADAVFEASAAGDITFSAYLDGVQMPCTIKTISVDAGGTYAVHTETDVAFTSCCGNVSHVITFVITSPTTATGTVTNFCSGIIKEA